MGFTKQFLMFSCCLAVLLLGATASADSIYLSTNAQETLGGLTFQADDAVHYDSVSNSSTLSFDGANFTAAENVDALHVLANGNLLLSAATLAELGGVTFNDGDVIEYNPLTNMVVGTVMAESFFGVDVDIDAFSVTMDGNYLFSTRSGHNTLGFIWEDGDVVQYDPIAGVLSLYFDEDLFATGEDINGIHAMDDGSLLITTTSAATLGGNLFRDGDVALWNIVDGSTTLFFNEDLFSNSAQIDGVSLNPPPNAIPNVVPEPGTWGLFGAALAGLVALRARSRKSA